MCSSHPEKGRKALYKGSVRAIFLDKLRDFGVRTGHPAWISNCIPHNTVRCEHVSMPRASDTDDHICAIYPLLLRGHMTGIWDFIPTNGFILKTIVHGIGIPIIKIRRTSSHFYNGNSRPVKRAIGYAWGPQCRE